MKGDDISERLLDSAVRVGKVVDALPETRLGRHVADQLIRCGTSPAPNYEEARAGESRKDFVHKLRVCLKELCETHMWLRFLVKAEMLPGHKLSELLDECNQLCNIIGKSIATAPANTSSPR